jgi:hypothetical protein
MAKKMPWNHGTIIALILLLTSTLLFCVAHFKAYDQLFTEKISSPSHSSEQTGAEFSSAIPNSAFESLKKWKPFCFASVIEKFRTGAKQVEQKKLRALLNQSQNRMLDAIPRSLNIGSANKQCHHQAEIEVFFEPIDKILTVQWSIFELHSKNKLDEFSVQVFK